MQPHAPTHQLLGVRPRVPSPRVRRLRGPLGARTRAARRHPGAAAPDLQLAVGEAGPAGPE